MPPAGEGVQIDLRSAANFFVIQSKVADYLDCAASRIKIACPQFRQASVETYSEFGPATGTREFHMHISSINAFLQGFERGFRPYCHGDRVVPSRKTFYQLIHKFLPAHYMSYSDPYICQIAIDHKRQAAAILSPTHRSSGSLQ